METIGFIGLGVMGKPMARNLLKAGYPLVVHTRTRAKAEDLLREGARWADNAFRVAKQCQAIITMLPDTPDVKLVCSAVLRDASSGTLLMDMSTISPSAAREIARDAHMHGVEFLDAPVSGGEVGAINATLSIMVGGSETAFLRALPIFQVLGNAERILLVGESGAGQIAKAANQMIVGITIAAVSEALTLAKRASVDPAKVRQALLGGFAQSRVLDVHGQRMLERNFTPGARVRTQHKDMQIGLALGKEFGTTLPVTALVDEMYSELLVEGKGDLDHSSLVTWIEDKSQ
jgi:2-hydroxy-3-oxopropionate reductase